MTNNKPERLFWSNFQEVYLNAAAPARLPVLDEPRSEIITEPIGGRIALRVWTDEPVVPIRTPRAIDARYLSVGTDRFLEISTSVRHLHHPFFNLIFAICDRLASGSTSAAAALEQALADYKKLLAVGDFLSEQQVLGLFGELWMLLQLLKLNGPKSLSAWTGPLRLPHDFRYKTTELEVKTTASADRHHRIHGATQLMPSVGCKLYLISIQAQPTGPGAGQTVPEITESIASLLAPQRQQLGIFRERLDAAGYLEEHSLNYNSRWTLRTPPRAILVDKEFPRLTQTQLDQLLDANNTSRLFNVEYTLDVTNLGFDSSTEQFQKLIMT